MAKQMHVQILNQGSKYNEMDGGIVDEYVDDDNDDDSCHGLHDRSNDGDGGGFPLWVLSRN